MNIENKLGEKIKFYRKKLKLTQEQLAQKSGLSRNAIYNYENNKRSPDIDTLNKIAEALGTDTKMLLVANVDVAKAVKNMESYIKKKHGNSKLSDEIIWKKALEIYENAPNLDNLFLKELNDLKYDKEPSAYFTLFQVLAEIYAMELASKVPDDKAIDEMEKCLKILRPKLQGCINDLQDYIDAMIKEKFRKIIDGNE